MLTGPLALLGTFGLSRLRALDARSLGLCLHHAVLTGALQRWESCGRDNCLLLGHFGADRLPLVGERRCRPGYDEIDGCRRIGSKLSIFPVYSSHSELFVRARDLLSRLWRACQGHHLCRGRQVAPTWAGEPPDETTAEE